MRAQIYHSGIHVLPGGPVLQSVLSCARRASVGAAAMVALCVPALAPAATATVPYVPTPYEVVDRMLEIAKVTKADYLIDLGSGDGRIVVTAARKHGARGFGVDLNPTRIAEANENAQKARVTDRVSFIEGDLFDTDLTTATVITMYLLPRVNLDLRPRLLQLKPGTRIVSHDFSMDDWKPDHHEQLEVKKKYGEAGGISDSYFWVVPAKVGGKWQSQMRVRGKPVDYHFTLDQKFQFATGSAQVNGRSVPIRNARVRGDRLTFDFTADVGGGPTKHVFDGTVAGDTINGTADFAGSRLQARLDWTAKQAP